MKLSSGTDFFFEYRGPELESVVEVMYGRHTIPTSSTRISGPLISAALSSTGLSRIIIRVTRAIARYRA